MTDEFERRHGFPPGTNEVRPADHDDQAAARTLAQASVVPPDLVTFYNSIGDITWEDVGNGYFVDPAGDVLLRLKEYGSVDAGAGQKARGLVIGSNGGGLSYAAGPRGMVYRTRTASLDEPEPDHVADDLRQFLELLGCTSGAAPSSCPRLVPVALGKPARSGAAEQTRGTARGWCT